METESYNSDQNHSLYNLLENTLQGAENDVQPMVNRLSVEDTTAYIPEMRAILKKVRLNTITLLLSTFM
jgi:hypothetical protein